MNKYTKKSTIFALILAVVFLNVTLDVHATELQNRAELGSFIGTSASHNFQQSLVPSQTNLTDVENTGNEVTADNTNQQSNNETTNNENTATVEQDVNAFANTGYNIAERNISIGGNAGMITTGDAGVLTAAQINSNSNTALTNNNGAIEPFNHISLGNTGNQLTSSSSNDITRMIALQNNNKTTVVQHVDATANTGGNLAPRNISIGGQAGVIQTGNAYTGTNLLLAGNGNVALVGGDTEGYGPGSGASVVLLNTGNRLNNTTSYRNQATSTIQNNNFFNVSQSCGTLYNPCIANTGNNTSNRNINPNGSAGVIYTGNAIVAMSAALQGNSNASGVHNSDAGSTLQSTNAANTGDDSNITNSTQQSNNKSINNNNNVAIEQNMNAYANTGYNEARRNIAFGGDAGIIRTGAAYVMTFLSGLVNSNKTQ